jgi:hypothetical protein
MTARGLEDFMAFFRAHRDHDALTGGTSLPDEDGYTAEAVCPCGAT